MTVSAPVQLVKSVLALGSEALLFALVVGRHDVHFHRIIPLNRIGSAKCLTTKQEEQSP